VTKKTALKAVGCVQGLARRQNQQLQHIDQSSLLPDFSQISTKKRLENGRNQWI
jgi:hypothetical protein